MTAEPVKVHKKFLIDELLKSENNQNKMKTSLMLLKLITEKNFRHSFKKGKNLKG